MVSLNLKDGYKIKTVTVDNLNIVEVLNDRCSDYYILHEGEPPSKKDALEIFSALPPGKTYEDKFVMGIYTNENNLIGIIDIVKNFPVEGEWMLGLLFIDPEERSKGLGKQVHETLAQWVITLGAKSFRIGVIEENHMGKKFWSNLGYKKIKEGSKIDSNKKTHIVNVMTKQISD